MLVKNKAFSVLEIVLLLVFTIIIASSIYSIYLTHKYTTRISNTMAKLKLIKTQVTAELNYGNGHIAKEKSQNGLYALTNISDKKVNDYSSSNILIKDNGEISLKLDDRYLGKGNIIMTPYVKSRAKTEDPYIVWDCLVTTNKKIAQSLMPEECVVKLVNK